MNTPPPFIRQDTQNIAIPDHSERDLARYLYRNMRRGQLLTRNQARKLSALIALRDGAGHIT